MSNTVISLKKSSIPTAEPTTLANGELAINYADGKLFYKNTTGHIVSFVSGTNDFAVINANGTLIVSDAIGDILTMERGNNISIIGDDINDKITISSIPSGNTKEIQFNNSGQFSSASGLTFDIANNNLSVSNTIFAVHFDNVSDISLKENVAPLNDSINKLNNLYPVSFNWKSTKEQSFGLIAQEVEQILPQIVHQKDDGTKTVSYIQIIALLIDAVKDLQRQIDDINSK